MSMSQSQSVQEPVYVQVAERIEQQLERQRLGRLLWTMQEGGIDPREKLLVLLAEVGEVADALQERYAGTARANLKYELEDVAACALAWLFAIEARTQRKALHNG